MTQTKAPFFHARVMIELPFDLSIPSGLFPLCIVNPNAALMVIVMSDPSWVVGYTERSGAEGSRLLTATKGVGITSSSDEQPQKITEWVKNSKLDSAAIVAANTILELRMGLEKDEIPNIHEFSEREETQKSIVFGINQFISRYQVASGFRLAAGIVSAVRNLSNTVEHGGQKYDGKKPTEAFDELAEYVSDSKGLLKYFKNLINLKDANEQLHFAKVRKWRFKDFDFKSINIDNDTANVEVNIYDEVTTSVGGSISVTHVLDKYDNTIESKVSEYQPHDLITPGGDNHKITLEKVNNKWRIIHDAWDFLPEYRP